MATTEVEGIEKRWSLFKTAQDIVDEKFDRMMGTTTYEGSGLVDDMLLKVDRDINGPDGIKALLADARAALDTILVDADITLDDIEDIDVDDFAGVAPDPITITTNFPDAPTLMTEIENAIHDKLVNDLTNTSPAIPEDVEDAIFKRETERALLLHQDTLDNIADEWSKRGFTLPSLYLLAAISASEIDYANKRLDLSRDIAIENFKLTDANMKFSIEQGMKFMINRIEIYKTQIQAEVARIEAEVRVYMGQVEVYKGQAQVYSSLVDTEIREFEAKLKRVIAEADLRFKNIDNHIKVLEYQYTLAMEGIKAMTAIHAQTMAGALSGVSASAQISASNSGQYQYSSNPSY